MNKKKPKFPMHQNASASIFDRARALRKRETPTEKQLWERLKGKKLAGYKFRRQHPVSRYILDFYCYAKKLVIELDGAYHEERLQQWYDKDRTTYLEEAGLTVIRFSNKQVEEDIELVLTTILEVLENSSAKGNSSKPTI